MDEIDEAIAAAAHANEVCAQIMEACPEGGYLFGDLSPAP